MNSAFKNDILKNYKLQILINIKFLISKNIYKKQ